MKEDVDELLTEEMLIELHHLHLINWVQYVELHSNEMKEDYLYFCETRGLDNLSDDSAKTYLKDLEDNLYE